MILYTCQLSRGFIKVSTHSSTKSGVNYHVIKDPVYGTMQFTDEENNWIKPFLDTLNFQRLRHIKQLGMGDLVFPGGVHTRFNHSLGCCYFGGQIAHKLHLSTEDRQMVMLACLLHDMGHGPFSHAFEHLFPDNLIQHEDWTALFVEEYDQADFIAQFNENSPEYPLDHQRFAMIINLIAHQESEHKLLGDIVSSQLDADRLDYLQRDSHFCGVTYGKFDARWLLHCLTQAQDTKGQDRLGITYKGVGVVEEYLMARRLMMFNVYFHGKKFGSEHLVTQFLYRVAWQLEHEPQLVPIKSTQLGQFLLAIKQLHQDYDNASNQKAAQALKQAFLKNNYVLYKSLCDYDVLQLIRFCAHLDLQAPFTKIAQRLQKRNLPKTIRLGRNQLPAARELVAQFQADPQIEDWQLQLMTIPHRSYQSQQDPIWVKDKMGQMATLEEYSLFIKELSGKYENNFLLIVDRSLLDRPAIQKFLNNA